MARLMDAIRFPRGFRVDAHVRAEMAERWNLTRPIASGLTILAGVVVGLIGFERAWMAIVMAGAVLLHALATQRRPNAAIALALDIPLTFVTLELIGVPTAVMSLSYVTFGVIMVLMCEPLARVMLGVLASLLFAGVAFSDLHSAQIPSAWAQTIGWIASAILIALLLAVVAMTVDLLQRHVEDVDRTNQQVQALADSKDALISTVSHEIRTPLAAVLGFSNVLEDSWESFTPSDGRAMAHLIAVESQTIAYIVDDLVVAARAELNSLAVALEPVRLHTEISAFFDEYTRIQDPIDIIGQDVEVQVDPPRFRQILRHLLSNAVSHGGDRIWIETELGPGVGFVRICDSGDGIPEELHGDIFAPYTRGSDKVTQPESFGLGLTVARRLAHAMGGSLTYLRTAETSIFELALRRTESNEPSTSMSGGHILTEGQIDVLHRSPIHEPIN